MSHSPLEMTWGLPRFFFFFFFFILCYIGVRCLPRTTRAVSCWICSAEKGRKCIPSSGVLRVRYGTRWRMIEETLDLYDDRYSRSHGAGVDLTRIRYYFGARSEGVHRTL